MTLRTTGKLIKLLSGTRSASGPRTVDPADVSKTVSSAAKVSEDAVKSLCRLQQPITGA